MNFSFNRNGTLRELKTPSVMGILNITPDSFYSSSRVESADEIAERVEAMVKAGAEIIDVGACSTRPGFTPVSAEEELRRLEKVMPSVKEAAGGCLISIDTYQAAIAETCIREWKVDIINDVSCCADPDMPKVIAETGAVYVLTHNRTDGLIDAEERRDVTASVVSELAFRLDALRRVGMKDVIIDPGFGFAKTLEENYRLFAELESFRILGCPILVGISRKSMITKELGVKPEEALAGTVALDAIALYKGADIIRVHDVGPAVETVRIVRRLKGS